MAAITANAGYRRLDPQKIIETVKALRDRIEERFPGSGLGKVVGELLGVAEEAVAQTQWIQMPHFLLRTVAVVLSVGIVALVITLFINIRQFKLDDFVNTVQGVDSSISSVVFIGATIIFFVSWENRIKRSRAL